MPSTNKKVRRVKKGGHQASSLVLNRQVSPEMVGTEIKLTFQKKSKSLL